MTVRDLTPGRIGFSTVTKLKILSSAAMTFTDTTTRKVEGSKSPSMTIKTIPAEARPSVMSKTHKITVECFRDIHPQQQDVATLKQ